MHVDIDYAFFKISHALWLGVRGTNIMVMYWYWCSSKKTTSYSSPYNFCSKAYLDSAHIDTYIDIWLLPHSIALARAESSPPVPSAHRPLHTQISALLRASSAGCHMCGQMHRSLGRPWNQGQTRHTCKVHVMRGDKNICTLTQSHWDMPAPKQLSIML